MIKTRKTGGKEKCKRMVNSQSAITLVALVITIIIIIILATVTINMAFGDNGLIKQAELAKDMTANSIVAEQEGINEMTDYMTDISNGIGGANITIIPEGLEIGSNVSYNPSGTYNWQAKYCSSTKTETVDDVLLSSAIGENFNISSWKVLSIDESTGTVELVPSAQTIGTVYLGQAQGYNNGVKLLNDACSVLYGNNEKGITARSINLEDIEKYMTETALTEAHDYTVPDSNTKYGSQASNAYTVSKDYPAIYEQEKLAVIDGKTKENTGLRLSEQDTFIERLNEIKIATTSIQPYQTFWNKDATYMSTAFKDYTKQDATTANYYNLIMPEGTDTTYWIATRRTYILPERCDFHMSNFYLGNLGAGGMFGSNGGVNEETLPLYPVITLDSNLIEGDASSGFNVN